MKQLITAIAFAADKHRNHALSLGVNAYLGKPYRDDELLGQVAMFTSSRRRQAGA